ncbi:MAG TPA: ComF family protein [Candidatus Saccharimonadales bacterium]|nr:ComF family protein [Candidatus Saccharimonadales bacterium]
MSIFETIIGLLAPPQCIVCGIEGLTLCETCALGATPFGELCWRCNRLSPNCRTCDKCRLPGSPIHVWITGNYEGVLRELLSVYKFGHQRSAGGPIARQMVNTLMSFNSEVDIFQRDYLVVAVPTATSRARQRGFGHAELLARQIARKLRLDHSNELRRLGQARQVGSARQERLSQLKDVFAIKNYSAINGRNILLIDDVLTTGGTLTSATTALRQAGARRVDALLLAKKL